MLNIPVILILGVVVVVLVIYRRKSHLRSESNKTRPPIVPIEPTDNGDRPYDNGVKK